MAVGVAAIEKRRPRRPDPAASYEPVENGPHRAVPGPHLPAKPTRVTWCIVCGRAGVRSEDEPLDVACRYYKGEVRNVILSTRKRAKKFLDKLRTLFPRVRWGDRIRHRVCPCQRRRGEWVGWLHPWALSCLLEYGRRKRRHACQGGVGTL